jgi:hypothetical protein
MVSDLTFFLPSTEPALPVPLNAPIAWWYLWKSVIHGKDEVLRLKTIYMARAPIPEAAISDGARALVASLKRLIPKIDATTAEIHDWLNYEFGLKRPERSLERPHALDADGFVAAVRAAFPKTRKWSAAEIARLKQEYIATLTLAREAAAEVLAIERQLSDLVNAAYGLTPEEVALMWRTAPPRMPLDPKEELGRLGFSD